MSSWNEDHWDRLLTRVESAAVTDRDDEAAEREYVDATDALRNYARGLVETLDARCQDLENHLQQLYDQVGP